MKYEILDLSKSLFQETIVIEAASTKLAAQTHFGFRVERCVDDRGYILVWWCLNLILADRICTNAT